jgi:3-oxoadipate enol-lactonase
MPYFANGNVSLHYERSGVQGAPALVLSSSLGTTAELWTTQLPEFEQHYDVIRYDMRGHGASSVPMGPYSVEQLSDDVLGLINELQLADVAFCGISIGGAIGQWLAIHAPEGFRAFILCNTAAKIGTLENWKIRIATVRQEGMNAVADRILQGWFTSPFREVNPETVARMRAMLTQCDPAGYVSTCAAVRDVDLRNAVHQIRKPVCIFAGKHDLSTTVEDAQFLHRAIEGSKLVELPAAHISNIEAATQFTAAVLDFLKEQDSHG